MGLDGGIYPNPPRVFIMLRVRCQASATVDAKGRMALPAPLRRALAVSDVHSLVLTFHRGAVWGWTPEEFERTVERPLADADPFNTEVMGYSRLLKTSNWINKVEFVSHRSFESWRVWIETS